MVENKTFELNFTLSFAASANISGSVNASECGDSVDYSISYSSVCSSGLNLTLNALTGNSSVNISFGNFTIAQNLSDLTLNYSFYGINSGELKITVCSHTLIYNISCRKIYGSNCSKSDECTGFCVHGKCRNSETYCGDGYCDSKETCSIDCAPSGGSLGESYCSSCSSGGSGSSGGGSYGFYGGSYASAEVLSGDKVLFLSSPSGTVFSGLFNFTLKDDKNNPVADAKVSLTLENGSVIGRNT